MHRLKVTGFLGIRNADITLDGLTVLIGAQASGKSVIARLVYFFNEYFSDFNIPTISRNEHKSTYDKLKKEEFYKIFPQYSWERRRFRINYRNNDHEVTISSAANSSVIEIQTSASVANYFRSLKRNFKKFSERDDDISILPGIRSRLRYRAFMKDSELTLFESALFVPAARSFYATIRDEIFSILALDEKIDHMILKFGEFYESVKSRSSRHPSYRRFVRRGGPFHSIVKGKFERENDRDWLVMDHGRIELSKASSGQQEAIPMLFAIWNFPRRGRTLIIEEPEAHLFPKAQVEVLEFMIHQLRTRGGNIMFTTHSPYLLSALNNHILALSKISDSSVSADQVRAYSITDGHSSSLMDPEVSLISADYIDSVSDSISEEFVELMEMD